MPGTGRPSPFLARLDAHLRARLDPLLEPVSLRTDQVLIIPGQPIEHVHFLSSGLASVSCGAIGRHPSVALIGPEAFTGHCLMLGRDASSCRTLMQAPGSGHRIRAADLRRLAEQEPALRTTLLHSVDDLIQQISESAFANAQMTVEARLARLLLMASERLGASEMRLTHDRIALMLGCRRAGVTMSIHILEGEHAIRATRAHIKLLDRAKLREIADAQHRRHDASAEPTIIPPPIRPAARI